MRAVAKRMRELGMTVLDITCIAISGSSFLLFDSAAVDDSVSAVFTIALTYNSVYVYFDTAYRREC